MPTYPLVKKAEDARVAVVRRKFISGHDYVLARLLPVITGGQYVVNMEFHGQTGIVTYSAKDSAFAAARKIGPTLSSVMEEDYSKPKAYAIKPLKTKTTELENV